jgi:hypothetical protein
MIDGAWGGRMSVSRRPGPIKGKTGQRGRAKAAQNALETGGARTMPNHTLKFIEAVRAAVIAQPR